MEWKWQRHVPDNRVKVGIMSRAMCTAFCNVALCFLCALFLGCGHAHIKQEVSAFDHSVNLTLNAEPLTKTTTPTRPVQMALRWESQSPSHVKLIISVQNSADFSTGKCLQFNVDGKRYVFEPSNKETITIRSKKQDNAGKESVTNVKYFIVPKEFIARLSAATTANIRLTYKDRTHQEASLEQPVKEDLGTFIARISDTVKSKD